MNDQNSNQTGVTPNVAPPTQPVQQPVQPVQPAQPSVATATPEEIAEPAPKIATQPEVTPVTPTTDPVPVEQPVAEPSPVVDPAPTPVVEPTPVQEAPVDPAPVDSVAEPAQQTTTPAAPVESTPEVAPVVNTPAAPVESAPAPTPQVVQQAPVQPTDPAPVQAAPQQSAVPNVPTIDGAVVTENNLNSGINSLNALGPQNVSDVGFVATGEVIKKKTSKSVVIAIVVLVVILLGLLGYFVIYPWVVKTYMSNPRNVYEATINEVAKNLNTTVNDVLHEKMTYDINVALDTNIASLHDFSGYTYGVNLGVDPNKKLIQYGLYLVNPTGNEKSFYNYLKDDSNYQKFSSYESIIYTGKANMDSDDIFVSFREILDTYNRTNAADTNYIIEKVRQSLIDSIDESKLSKEDASIKINGNSLKVIANKYEMDADNQKRTIQVITKALLEDEKALDILSSITGEDKALIRGAFDDLQKEDNLSADSEKNEDTSFTIIIYTHGNKNDVVGYAVETKKDGNLHYYNKDGYEEFVFNYVYNDLETEKEATKALKVIGNKSGSATKYDVSMDDKKVAEITVRSLTNKKVDLDYSVTIDDYGTYTGTIKYDDDRNDSRSKATLEFTLNINDDKLSVKANITQDWTSEVANINTKTATQLSDTEKQEVYNQFLQSLSDTPVGLLFKTESGEFDPSVFSFYTQKSIVNPTIESTVCANLDANGNYELPDDGVSCINGSCSVVQNGQTQTFNCYSNY